LNEFTKGLKKRFGTPEQWMTKGGIFTTKAKCRVPIILPDFTRQTKVEFDCHVDPTQKSINTNYDIILGKTLCRHRHTKFVTDATMGWH
jgi:hypothetical protein